ncbi:MAG: hypothetical protein C0P74_010265 [Gammaproteobacteria bacterium]|nr:hypothetical protein [Gammaproteobacteria bacterium]
MANRERTLGSGKPGITERIKQDGREKIESTKRSAADRIEQLARVLTRAGEELSQTQPTMAHYASQLGSGVSKLAARVREGEIDDLIEDTRELARRNPGLFLAGSALLGFALARFLKASGDEARSPAQFPSERVEGYSRGTAYSDTARSASYESTQPSSDTSSDMGPSYASVAPSQQQVADDLSTHRPNGG